jgi:hypothetical protein
MLEKSSIFIMLVIAIGAVSLVVGISSGIIIIYKPANVQAVPCGFAEPARANSNCTGEMPSATTGTKGPVVKSPITQQQEPNLLQLTPKHTLGKRQQQTGITGTLIGKISTFLIYASSDGKTCIAYATISTRLYYPNYPLGLKPGDSIELLVPDETMCVLLGQANAANKEIGFRVTIPAVTAKELPPYIQQNFAPKAAYRAVLFYILPS